MNIVVWGTAGNASRFIKKILPVCAEEMGINIVSVADDCEAREGSCFCGYKVVHPKNIDSRTGVDYIVQLETFSGVGIDESKALLPSELRNKLIDLPDFCKVINSSGFWKDKSVLFIGDKDELDGYAYGAKYIFKHHEYYENIEKFSGNCSDFDYIFTCGKWYTSQEQSVKEGNIIRKAVLEKYKYDEDRILDSTVWGVYLHSGNCLINTNGELNPDKKFLVLTFDRYCGWAIIQLFFAHQIEFARNNGYIPVIDMKNYKTQYISDEDLGKVNVWEKYFEQVSEYSLEEVYSSKTVYLCGKRFNNDVDNNGKIRYNFTLNQEFSELKNSIFPKNGEKVLGVVYRGTDFSSAFDHPKPIDIGEFIDGVEAYRKKIGYDHIFLATEVEDVVELFKEKYGEKVSCVSQQRFKKDEKRFLANVKFDRKDDEHIKSIDYLSVLYLLTCCDSIYGIYCGSTRYAKAFSDKYEHYYTFSGVKNKSLHNKITDIEDKIFRKIARNLKIGEYSARNSIG